MSNIHESWKASLLPRGDNSQVGLEEGPCEGESIALPGLHGTGAALRAWQWLGPALATLLQMFAVQHMFYHVFFKAHPLLCWHRGKTGATGECFWRLVRHGSQQIGKGQVSVRGIQSTVVGTLTLILLSCSIAHVSSGSLPLPTIITNYIYQPL